MNASGSPDHVDALASVAEGIYAYLKEIDGYRAVCRRHEGAAAVFARDNVLHATRFLESDSCSTAVAHLEVALGRLPHRSRSGSSTPPETDPSYLVQDEIVWENRRLVVSVQRVQAAPLVEVDLSAPPWDSDLPELPLRRLADVLRCHEFLIPEVVATPARPPGGGRFLGVREYLKRAMPPNLYASQCI